VFAGLKRWLFAIKRDAHALYLAARDPRVPWHAKALSAFIAAYAFSPIDLIPDFIPVLGLLDDAIILPLGIWLAVKLIPPAIMAEHRHAAEAASGKPVSRAAGVVLVAVWVLLTVVLIWLGLRLLGYETSS
jgi:uncharacterized membrane protein YkvA (DUF1232 family)